MGRCRSSWILAVILLIGALDINAQDDDPADDPPAGGEGGDGGGDDQDEAWEYVTYLKERSSDVEEILQKTLVEAKDRPGFAVLDDTVAKTMTQVMEIRESLLDRIKMIRKEEIYIDPDQNIRQEEMLADFRMSVMEILLKLVDKNAAKTEHLKEISQDLLRFKIALGNEVMRILMLPEKTSGPVRPDRDQSCFQCASLVDIRNIVENLVECAKKEDDGGDATNDYDTGDAPIVDAGDSGDSPAPGTDCVPPQMYAMDLITANEIIDKEITEHYGKIVVAKDEERKKLFDNLESFKQLRNSIDEIITKLMNEGSNADADQKLKKTIQRGLTKTSNELKDKVTDCQKEFCPNDCESCAADILVEAKDKMEFFKESTLAGSEDEASKKDSIRTDLIKYITDTGNEARKILINKASGPISACETEKLDTYKKLKSPMWMVVNTTIFSDLAMVEEMVEAMIANLDEMIDERCGSDAVIVKVNNALNCEWDEYEETKNYLEIVDGIIQKNLFKAPEDAEAEQAKVEALLGFVDIQAAFDKRVKALFEANLECPDEAKQIKSEYMTKLNTCMTKFMDIPKLRFQDLSRTQRIACTKDLRTAMEDRMSSLLEVELQKSLNDIGSPDYSY